MKAAAAPAKAQHAPERRPFRWEAVTAISTLLLALTTFGALLYTARQIKDFREAERVHNEAERVHQLVEQRRWFDSSGFIKVRKKLAGKRLDKHSKTVLPLNAAAAPGELYEIMNYFEELGLLEEKGYLDAQDIWDELSYWAFNIYYDAKPAIDHDRQDDPSFFLHFEKLVGKLQQIEKQRTGRENQPTGPELLEFYQYENSLTAR